MLDILKGKTKHELCEIIDAAGEEFDRIVKEEKEKNLSKIEVGKYYYTTDAISCNFYYKILSLKPAIETFEVTLGDYVLIDPDKRLNENIIKDLKEITKEKFIEKYNTALKEIQEIYEEIIVD